jgi:hypothetical protein
MLPSMKSKVAIVTLMLVAVALTGPWSPAPVISRFVALILILVAGAFIGPWSRVVAFATIAGIIAVVVGILMGDPDDLESAAFVAVASFAGGMLFGALVGAKVNQDVSRLRGQNTNRLLEGAVGIFLLLATAILLLQRCCTS